MNSISRLTLLAAALAFAPAQIQLAQQTRQTQPPATAASAATTSCCGAITPEGHRLEALIDSMDVEHLWLAHEHVNWETGEPDKDVDYDGPGRSTHCSAFAAALAERLNVYMLRPPEHGQILLASAQARWFHDPQGVNDGWKELQGADHERWAQELANQGNLVGIVYESPDPHRPGHIVIVRPSEKSTDALHKDGPQITQAGTNNHASSIAARSFTSHPGAWPNGVRYYWHFVDWSSLKPSTPAAKPANQ
jgi:hypothetical protein